jgi:hypothetical protein
MKSFSGGKKPANQGSAGKAYEQPVKKIWCSRTLQNQVRQQIMFSLHNHLVQKVENHQSTLVSKQFNLRTYINGKRWNETNSTAKQSYEC